MFTFVDSFDYPLWFQLSAAFALAAVYVASGVSLVTAIDERRNYYLSRRGGGWGSGATTFAVIWFWPLAAAAIVAASVLRALSNALAAVWDFVLDLLG